MGESKLLFAPLSLVIVACAGGEPPPTTPVATSVAKESPPPVADAPAPAPAPAATDDDDPNESSEPIVMQPLVAKGARPSFPKSTVGDRECWQNLQFTGKHQSDYDKLAAGCGAPTGLIEYAKPATGHLHHEKDRRDTYRVDLRGGLCYRYFAAGDVGITDMDLVVETTAGAIVATDELKGSVAIIDSSKVWCQSEDTTLDFHVQVKGTGAGKYVFGVWARAK